MGLRIFVFRKKNKLKIHLWKCNEDSQMCNSNGTDL